ncbi:MAG: type III-A CRISPR-associated RAMP protein Csm3 [Lachnospiraceae bacterium]|jgi:CRISPR-associated protein Csm3
MYGKIEIAGTVEVLTGMHIGGSSDFSAIGAVDSPVMRDVLTNLPMIPGSSFKGKIRTLLAREYDEKVEAKPDNDDERILRLFGSAKQGHTCRSRILVPDMMLTNEKELRARGAQSVTEIKFENSINRATAVANPRQIERSIRGSEFGMNLIYECVKDDEIVEDFEMLGEGMRLLQMDYLGADMAREATARSESGILPSGAPSAR